MTCHTDFRVDPAWFTHAKAIKLQRRTFPGAHYHVLELWAYASRHHPLGDLSGLDAESLGVALNLPPHVDPQTFVQHMVDIHLLDGTPGAYSIHDWEEHNEYVFRRPERIAKASRAGQASGEARRRRAKERVPKTASKPPIELQVQFSSTPFPSLPFQNKEAQAPTEQRAADPYPAQRVDLPPDRKEAVAEEREAMGHVETMDHALAEMRTMGWTDPSPEEKQRLAGLLPVHRGSWELAKYRAKNAAQLVEALCAASAERATPQTETASPHRSRRSGGFSGVGRIAADLVATG
jgi:hypothetical protein